MAVSVIAYINSVFSPLSIGGLKFKIQNRFQNQNQIQN